VISASSWRCDPSSDGAVPIGRPVANTQIYLLDADLRPLPIGAPGELCIGGVQVARGYLNQPGLTAERFVANPFRPEERIYRTGDMARYRSDGVIEFLGRRDHQVKIRGNRVECGEVEAVLAAHPAVAKAVVVARTDEERGEQRLVAYIVPAGNEAPRIGELRAHVGSHVPAYMVPAAFITVEALPLTPSGKVDRLALPGAEAGRLGAEAAYVAARTDAEVTLAEIWAQLLRVDRIGTDDNFFELGGDSIDAIRVIARANRAGLRLSQAQLFEHPTVAGLAAAAEASEEVAVEGSVAESLQRTTSDTGKLSPSDFPLAGLDQATLDRLLG
jgi:aryl carrier-like protein